jgi:hypothetical protein
VRIKSIGNLQASLALGAPSALLRGQSSPIGEEVALGLGYVLEMLAEQLATQEATTKKPHPRV